MFGHQDDKKDNHDDGKEEPKDEAVTAPTDSQSESEQPDQGAPAVSSDDSDSGTEPSDAPSEPVGDDTPVSDDEAWQHPGDPLNDDKDGSQDTHGEHDDQPGPISDVIAPAGSGSAQNPIPPMPINARDLPDDDGKTPHELIDIKQKALGELKPLLGQLEQSPEEKFRTLMMIIQASDNQDLLTQAYEAAEAIKDDKVRAQALLDVVNEINYFTQHPSG